MTKPTFFIFDVDGVLLDWVKGFEEWIPNFVFPSHLPENTTGNDSSYSLAERYNFDAPTMNHYVRLFNDSLAFSDLRPIDGSQEVFNSLSTNFDNQISFLTSFFDPTSEDIEARQSFARNQNLQDAFYVDVDTIYEYLPLGSDKYDRLVELKEYANDSGFENVVFLDDKPAHVLEGVKAGVTSHLLLQSYNMKHEIAGEYGVTWNAFMEKYVNG